MPVVPLSANASALADLRTDAAGTGVALRRRSGEFAQQVETMLESDFALSKELPLFDLEAQSWWFRFKVRYANLFAQIL